MITAEELSGDPESTAVGTSAEYIPMGQSKGRIRFLAVTGKRGSSSYRCCTLYYGTQTTLALAYRQRIQGAEAKSSVIASVQIVQMIFISSVVVLRIFSCVRPCSPSLHS